MESPLRVPFVMELSETPNVNFAYSIMLAMVRRIANMEEVSAAEAQDLLIGIGEKI